MLIRFIKSCFDVSQDNLPGFLEQNRVFTERIQPSFDNADNDVGRCAALPFAARQNFNVIHLNFRLLRTQIRSLHGSKQVRNTKRYVYIQHESARKKRAI